MQIQINTDHNIEGHEGLTDHVSNVVQDALSQFREHIMRVEVHLSDENGPGKDMKAGLNDKRCMMEARIEGHHPLAVTAHAASVHQAIDGAAQKLERLVESTLGRKHDRRYRHAEIAPNEEAPSVE